MRLLERKKYEKERPKRSANSKKDYPLSTYTPLGRTAPGRFYLLRQELLPSIVLYEEFNKAPSRSSGDSLRHLPGPECAISCQMLTIDGSRP